MDAACTGEGVHDVERSVRGEHAGDRFEQPVPEARGVEDLAFPGRDSRGDGHLSATASTFLVNRVAISARSSVGAPKL